MTNILFRTAGGRAKGKQLGLGHIFRTVNLASNFQSKNVFFLIEDYGGAREICKKRGFNNIFIIKKNIDLFSDIKQTLNHIKKYHIDVLVVDRYGVSIRYLKSLKKFVKTVLITDLWKVDYPVDLLVNGFIGFKNNITINRYGAKCLLGPAYQILDKKFSKKNTKKKKEFTLLTTFGGFDEKQISGIILRVLLNHKGKISTKIILGPSTIISQKIRSHIKELGTSIKVVKSTCDMRNEISNTKFGICAGGLTTYEFASMNVPFAIICDVPHQLETAREWQKKGLALNLGLVDMNTGKKIESILKDLSNGDIPFRRNHNIHIDGFGGKRVSNEILKI